MLEMFSAWLEPVRAQLPADFSADDSACLSDEITRLALNRFGQFLDGIRAYQNAPARRDVGEDIHAIWQKGTTRLLDYGIDSQGAIILVVPSLINRFEILDIDQERSFLRFLAGQGYRPLVLDWDIPGVEEGQFTLADYVEKRLEPALDVAFALMGGRKVHLLGYCMGGVMAVALAARQKQRLSTLTLMATPWDFEICSISGVPPAHTFMGQMFLQQSRIALSCLSEIDVLHPSFLQAVFAGFQPLPVLQKFMQFAVAGLPDERVRRFVLTEDWLNNGVPLSLPVAKECLELWYAENALAKNKWDVGGTIVDPSGLDLPCCLMIPQEDKVVPPESAKALASALPQVQLIEPPTGHLGLMVSDRARENVWEPYVSWLQTVEPHRSFKK
ncbi:MAG: alpha/beta fold hydrolase [Alphaproteobacteria bacterium]|nr:alpha/beta fold hydrolase [Alphaproteobacteria bacterium]